MHRIILLALLIASFITANAQNHGTVKATVIDSATQQSISFATVSILRVKDTSLISYTITDKKGEFTLRNLKEEPSRLLISHVGYGSLHINVNLKKDQSIDLGKLYLASKILEEVTVRGERIPVIIKKDTIEFNAEAFKTRPNALVEDLLKKLPGVQVDHDGTITVNGKNISKIKVDGKDFFVNDPKIATRNLDADMISKVQVYDDRENDPDHIQPDYEVKKIINLKFKKKFLKSVFGKGAAGVGTQDRYQANAFGNRFNGDQQISATVNSNNLSGTGTSDELRLPAFAGGSGGISKSTIGSVNYNDKLGKNITLNMNYEFRLNTDNNKSTIERQQFIGDTTFNTNTITLQHRYSNDQGLHIKTEWKPDTITTIKYNPDITYGYNTNNSTGSSISANNFVPLLNTNTNSDHSTGNTFIYLHELNYYRKLNNKGASLNITNNVKLGPENNRDITANDLVSYIATLPSDTLRRSSKNTNNYNTVGLSAGYHYPISKKIIANVVITGNHDRNGGELVTYDLDPKTGLYSIFLQNQSSDLIRSQSQQILHPDVTYQFTDNIALKVGVSAQLQQVSNHFNNYTNNLNQHFAYLLPTVELRLHALNLSYSDDLRQPSINDLQPITIVYSPLFSFTGNPNLKPTRLHTFGLNYFTYKPQSELFIMLNSRLTIESNSILRERVVNAEGGELSTPINRNGRFTANINGNVNKSFKKIDKWVISEQSSFNAIYGHNFFEVNHQDGYQNTSGIGFTQEMSANWNDIFEIRPAYTINSAITRYQLVNYANTTYTTQKADVAFDFFLPKKYTWSANYQYSYNPLVAPGFQRKTNLLSFSVARRLQKGDKGEFRLTCYDALNQNISAYHFASENTVNDIQNQQLRRYVMLTYTYRFNDFNK